MIILACGKCKGYNLCESNYMYQYECRNCERILNLFEVKFVYLPSIKYMKVCQENIEEE
ncbi:hypothetical protein LCGC14_2778750 [marine sediment metagenome]|uniref:Uncharacterized protein n=1 Tax=marine sediment metagenome TaxID=412755 RepID=A0A0F8ZFY8_9ZZZZ